MPKKRNARSKPENDRNIGMEELGPTRQRERQYTKRPSTTRQSSIPSGRPKSQIEEWEANLVDQLPSRQTAGAVGTMRLSRRRSQKQGFSTMPLQTGLSDLGTEEIVENLLNNSDFADGSVELQTQDIKGLHTNLAKKLSIRAKLRENQEKTKLTKRISWFKQVRYSISLLWKRTRMNIAEVSYSVDLWRGHLKKIEGKFGSGVASYFSFMIWLVQLNIPVFILLFSFITIPQLLHRTTQNPIYDHSVPFKGIEILTGEGWFNESELYYGTHYNGSIMRIPGLSYSMPHAYILTIAGYYIITVIALLFSLTKSYKKHFIDSSDMIQFQSVTKVLCGWDFAITAPQAASLKQQSIHKELEEYLSVFRTSEMKRTGCQKLGVGLVRIFINIVCITLIAASGYLIRYVSNKLHVERGGFYGLEQLALPLVISAVIFILPLIFSFLADIENYENPQVTLYLDMARTIVLFIVSLGVILENWLSKANVKSSFPEPTVNSTIFEDDSNITTMEDDDDKRPECWENMLGYNMYRLVVVDFLVTLIITFFTEFVRRLIARYCIKKLAYPEFNIGRNTLYLIYSQSLVWIAAFYSPLLPLIMILKLVMLFYVKRFSVMYNCKPSIKPWRGGRAHTIIMTMLGLALILCFISVGFSIIKLQPSVTCGPYQGKERAYTVIFDLFKKWAEHEKVLATIIEFATSTGFLAAIILGLLIAAYYTRIRARGLDDTVLALKEQIAMEGKDKKFLIKLIQSAGPPQSNGRGPRSKVRNYEHLPVSPANDRMGEEDTTLLEYHSSDEEYGGRQFAKATPQAVYDTPGGDYNGAPGAPRETVSHNFGESTPRNSGDAAGPPGGPPATAAIHSPYAPSRLLDRYSLEPPPHDSYNEGFVDKSWDPYDDQLEARGPGVNPAYDDRSLTNRPDLPYPGRHYDIIKGGAKD